MNNRTLKEKVVRSPPKLIVENKIGQQYRNGVDSLKNDFDNIINKLNDPMSRQTTSRSHVSQTKSISRSQIDKKEEKPVTKHLSFKEVN